jgi:hypothetical protein
MDIEVDIAMTMAPLFPNEAPFELSTYYPASRLRFVRIPAGVQKADFHTPPLCVGTGLVADLLQLGYALTKRQIRRVSDSILNGNCRAA